MKKVKEISDLDLIRASETLKEAKAANITIKKAKIKDECLEVEYSENTPAGISQVSRKLSAPVHADMIAAFAKLNGPFGDICEQFDAEGNTPECIVTGFVISGSGEGEGVVLMGYRILDHGQLNLVAPLARYSDAGENLSEIIEECCYEVREHLNGKVKVKQAELGFPEEEKFVDEAL